MGMYRVPVTRNSAYPIIGPGEGGAETFIRPGTTPELHGVDMFIRPSRSNFVGLPTTSIRCAPSHAERNPTRYNVITYYRGSGI